VPETSELSTAVEGEAGDQANGEISN